MKNIYFLLWLLSFEVCYTQSVTPDWNAIKKANIYHSNQGDSILLLKWSNKVDSKDTTTTTACYKLVRIDTPLIYAATNYGGYLVIYDDGNWYQKKVNDTGFVYLSYNKWFDPANNFYRGGFFYSLAHSPLFDLNFFENTLTTEIKNEKDITIVNQLQIPGKKVKRILYLKNSIVYKVELMPVSDFRTFIYDCNEYEFIRDRSFDEVCKEHHLGLYAPQVDYNVKKYQDSIRSAKSYNIALINKNPLQIDSTSKQLYLIDFWYLGCPPCRKLLPAIERISNFIDTNKIILLGMNPYDKNNEVESFIKKNKSSYSQIDGTVNNLKYYNIDEFPTLIIIDSKMKVIKTFVGYSDHQEKQIMKYLRKHKLLKSH